MHVYIPSELLHVIEGWCISILGIGMRVYICIYRGCKEDDATLLPACPMSHLILNEKWILICYVYLASERFEMSRNF